MDLIPDNLIDDNFILMHGDLVYKKNLLVSLITSPLDNCALVNTTVPQPKKDFKGRIVNEKITEIGVHIFDNNCYSLMPLYKLTPDFLLAWKKEISRYIDQGHLQVYAEDALNSISGQITLYPFYYTSEFCLEIDTPEDLLLAQSFIQKGD
jgi:phosphoenolpyruvate phosphomutase